MRYNVSMNRPLEPKMKTLTETSLKIAARFADLRKMDKTKLSGMVKAGRRLVDLRGADKATLVGMVLEAEFGRRACAAYDAEMGA
jgi:hypothetical protein